jgi:hypothetical protein
MSDRSRAAMTEEEVSALVAERKRPRLGTINPDGTGP